MSILDSKIKASNIPKALLINFDYAEIRTSQFNKELFLYVSGEQPAAGWNAMLAPLINQETPDYLHVEVLRARMNDTKVERGNSPYRLSLPLNSISGKKGVKLIGANGSKTFDI